MRKYSRKQVAKLATDDYVILIIDGLVYDVTSYLGQHPGGADILKSLKGKDATQQFRNTGHSQNALQRRKSFLIGQVDNSSWFKWWYVPIIVTGIAYLFNKAGRNLNKSSRI